MNPRCGFPHYSLSRGAPSATWVLLQANRHISIWKINGGESGIRTHGSFESPVFKTGSLNHSDISPQTEYRPRAKREIYYTIIATLCQSFWRKNRSRNGSGFLSGIETVVADGGDIRPVPGRPTVGRTGRIHKIKALASHPDSLQAELRGQDAFRVRLPVDSPGTGRRKLVRSKHHAIDGILESGTGHPIQDHRPHGQLPLQRLPPLSALMM